MKRFLTLFVASFLIVAPTTLVVMTGCTTSQQRKTVNTMFSVGKTVDSAYAGYLDLVVSGQISTNAVPSVSHKYAVFQQAFMSGIIFVSGNSNAHPPLAVLNAAADFTATVDTAKKGTTP